MATDYPSGINRNILECKVLIARLSTCVFYSINRNILECKDNSDSCLSNCFNVLIETYWNIKTYKLTYYSTLFFGINRNILECKGAFRWWFRRSIFRGGKNIPAFRSSDIFYRRRSAVRCSDFNGSGYYVNLRPDSGGGR